MVMATTDGNKAGGGTPSISRARLSTSVEPTGMAGTSWNSSRWTRPSSSNYRTGRMATMDAGGSNCSSSIASSSIGVQSPHSSYTLPTTATSFRSSDRAPSAATTTRTHQYDPTAVIRPNSRYGTSFLNSMSSNGSSSTAVTNSSSRPSQSASSNVLSPRHEPQRKSYPYRTSGFSQPRSTLIDMRQSLRPVKKQIVTDYSKSMPRSSAAIASAAPIPTTVPLTLFTNARTSSHPSAALSPVSPFAKCVSPPSSTMSRSSSTVTSPVTTPISSIQQRPIPKSERPWRQKLADAQRLRDAQADRTFGHHIPMNEAYDTTARILAARSARRASIEQQQTQKQQNNEQQLEKEIAALKCFVSEPGALDKNATVAKFRQRMAEGQVTASLAPTTSTSKSSSSSSTESTTLSNASSLLSRMPSLSRRSTTAVTKDALPKTQESKGKDRPLSMVETPLGERRLSVVCESPTSPTAKMPIGAEGGIAEKEQQQQQPMASSKSKGAGKTKESPKTRKKNTTAKDETQQQRPSSRTSTASNASSSGTKQIMPSPLKDVKVTDDKRQRRKANGGGEGTKKEQTNSKNGEEEKAYNAIFQFKPQSMLHRRKLSNEEEKAGTEISAAAKSLITKKGGIKKTATEPLVRRKTSHEESPKPVPGTWERTPKERFISQNKHLIRKAASESAVHARTLARVASVRILLAAANRLNSKEDNQSVKSLQNAVKATKGSPTQAVLKMIKSITKPKQQQQQQRVCAMTVLDTKLANKRSFRLGVRKTLLLKSIPPRLFAQLRCHCAQMATTTMRFNIVWKEQKKTANVTILLADWEEVVSGLIREQTTATKRLPEKTNNNNSSSPLKRIQQELDKENLLMVTSSTGRPVIIGGKGKELATKQAQQQQKVSSSNRPLPTSASLVAAAAGSITAAVAALTTGQASSAQTGILHNQQQPKQQQKVQQQKVQQPEPTTTKQPAQLSPKKLSTTKVAITPAGEVPLILPDHSVLEQFVQSNALDRLHEEAEGIIDQAKAGLQVPISSVPNTSVSLPGSKRNSQMIATAMPPTESQLPQSLSNSFHAAVQATAADLRAQQQQIMHQMARLRRPELSRATLSTQTLQAFEKPKSLFEDQMQRQAIHLQQKAVRQSLHEPSALERQQQQAGLNRRRSAAGDHADLAQTFVAQTQKPYQSEQRYAAHIPLSGRQSTASIESGNSNALDAASHQLDQMIDQARFKHNQQRNKFKEAIDYLDHIFEDFQREADMRQPATAKKAAPLLLQSQQRQQPSAQSGIVAVQESQQLPIEPIQATFHAPSNVKSSKEAFEKVAATIANENKANNNGIAGAAKLKKQTSAPAKVPTISVGLPQKTEPFPVIVHPPLTTTIGGAADNQVEDIEVAETIVLPSKNTADRLDFTRNWLANGDVGTWAEGSPRRGGDQLLGQRGTMPKEEEEYDSDHSLGSCSAEVAAINAANERQQRQRLQHQQAKKPSTAKKNGTAITQHLSLKNTNSKGQQQQQPIRQRQHPTNPGPTAAIVNGGNGTTTIPLVPLPQIAAAVPTAHGGTSQQQLTKPQPYRPQPQIGLMPPNFGASSQMQKVSSIEQLRPRASQERAGSQDYQSMGSSVHSQEGFRPAGTYLSTHSLQRLGVGGGTGGAFHSYTPTTMLPTHQQQPHPQQQQHQSSQNHLLKGSIQSLPDSALCTAPAGMATMRNSKYPGPTSTGGGYSHYNNNQQSHRQYSTATLGRTESQNNNQQNSQQQQNYNGKSHQHQPHLYNNNNNNTQFKSHRQQPKQEPPTVSAHQSGSVIVVNEHALAIDALVAELELNTDSALTASEKRRSFPTMKTEVARAKAATQIEGKNDEEAGDGTSSERRRQNKRGTTEMTTTNGHINLSSMATRGGSGSGELQRKQSIGSGTTNRPFETINQERLNPSKVDAMARMFDKSGGNGTGSGAVGRQATAQISFTSGGRNDPPSNSSWNRKAATTGRIPSNQRISSSSQQQSQDDYESGASSAPGGASAITATSISHQNGCTNRSQMQLRQPQPPHHHQRQDPHHASSYNSRQQHQSSPQIVRGTRAGTKTSINNRIAPVIVVERHRVNGNGDDDDDDLCNGNGNNNKNGCGLLYDNIQQQRHYTRPSPGYYTGDDSASLSSQTGGSAVLPPSATSNGKGGGSRIGQLIRKLGNVGQGKPPISAASMVSLHRVSNEPMGNGRNGGATVGNGAFDGPSLTKSNSLSGEPWKSQILEQQYGTIYGGEKDMIDEDKLQHSGGIGNRLKQTIFGGMVRRRVPT